MNKQDESRTCQNCKKDFTIETEDFNFYEKMKVPAPTWCPECRLQRRLTFRNERTLYKRSCQLCGADTLSRFDPDKKIVNYCGECWWSDRWDPKNYGQDYDFSRPFFAQFKELLRKVPQYNLITLHNTLINTDFTNMNHYLKNCYYIFNSDYNERCFYGEEIEHCSDCVDVTMFESSELAYESLNCVKCYQIYYSVDCESSHDIWFSKNLAGCSHCFGCVNLRSQQYCIFNEKYSREEYLKKLEEFELGSHQAVQKIKEKAGNFWLEFPNKYMHGVQNVGSDGDYIYNSRYVKNSFIVQGGEYCKYCMWLIVKNNKDCYDYTQFGENNELVYESLCCGKNTYDIIGSINAIEGRNIRYATYCYNNISNLFGCVSMNNHSYCILNKQYSKEEYEEMVPKIIKHMNDVPYVDKKGRTYVYGDFFPTETAQFDYNETSAQEFFPLTKEEVEEQGFSWKEPRDRNYKISIESKDLPDDIKDVPENIASEIIGCAHAGECKEQCTTAFRITEFEFKFYKLHKLPLPRLCPNCRHYQRVLKRNPNKFWDRECMCDKKNHSHGEEKCNIPFKTSYSPDRPEIVYCEKCYHQEVY
ncbi:MAG: hypothetical protein UW07_C0001G0017 [Candidatus Nomurabacteria bacterium GW2011_GWF2_43_8]|uniref:Zinc-binding domain-containing protein n=3 Tax=Candidatus Nomuraibacteriota TaxID=1752729 RepID=A0A0G1FS40_9BACT|nr:MAG: hypothetical protein UV76_C0013G0005 [Candidatus Nomurabacteria bacterium GW2011_GWA2_43_15]KKT19173.1 MAG: hypothetical protein UW02_C0014G0014 [Candidatus Nomurabacteria bacterium GW2011_GWB1_43_7]KKT25185.1 MAG: hypothetical protein UW07_C0001G0017 [Candidatus Nomurabacteria bacterium GW2011_GWF2_43_8]